MEDHQEAGEMGEIVQLYYIITLPRGESHQEGGTGCKGYRNCEVYTPCSLPPSHISRL